MMKNKISGVFTALALIAGVLCSAAPAYAWDDLAAMSNSIDQTNFIVGKGCSGTLIDAEQRLIVTAYHCVAGDIKVVEKTVEEDGEIVKKQVRITEPVAVQQKLYDGYDVVGSVLYVTNIVAHRDTRDLAILQVKTDTYNPKSAAKLLPKDGKLWRGQTVWAVGNPYGLDSSVSEGKIASTNRSIPWLVPNEKTPMIQYTASTSPGSSGGALYTEDGYYIATHVGGIPGENIGVGIPVSELYDLLLDENLMPNTSKLDTETPATQEDWTP